MTNEFKFQSLHYTSTIHLIPIEKGLANFPPPSYQNFPPFSFLANLRFRLTSLLSAFSPLLAISRLKASCSTKLWTSHMLSDTQGTQSRMKYRGLILICSQDCYNTSEPNTGILMVEAVAS
ncbi:uncharacterized protein LOC130821666 [Amaranthus tricolor]|uniref:uncharacterized protein LOC130821666 n=1 Tax=Amaranthus tricolor TaxID=29722 RepID=UPI00258D745E|nr:uncharacterized protein LOC130821666 [Amaranthus tricolor]